MASDLRPTTSHHGDPCTVEDWSTSGVDDSDIDSMCFGVDPDTLQGTCVARCTGDLLAPMCAPRNTSCMIASDGLLVLCLTICDPLADGCQPGEACVPTDDDFVCISTAHGEGGAAGDPCSLVYDCQPGLVCARSEAAGPPCDQGEDRCCTPYCDLSAPDPTAPCLDPGQMCLPWAEGELPPPLDTVGVCVQM